MATVLLGFSFICHLSCGEEVKPSHYIVSGILQGSAFVIANSTLLANEPVKFGNPPTQLLTLDSSQMINLRNQKLIIRELRF